MEGGGVIYQSKLFEDLFVLFMFGHFFRKGGGGFPYSKLLEELLSLSLDILKEGGGDGLIPKSLRNFSA
jgi:hypothetical protein